MRPARVGRPAGSHQTETVEKMNVRHGDASIELHESYCALRQQKIH